MLISASDAGVARPSRPKHAWKTTFLFTVSLVLGVCWTVALLVPIPKDSAREVHTTDWHLFLFGKTLHISAYMILTILFGSLPLSRARRVALLCMLLFHGIATEFFQQFFDRGASIRDVLLDWTGISLGVWLGWRWGWRELKSTSAG